MAFIVSVLEFVLEKAGKEDDYGTHDKSSQPVLPPILEGVHQSASETQDLAKCSPVRQVSDNRLHAGV